MKLKSFFSIVFVALLMGIVGISSPVHAYYTFMPADLVLGQTDFTSQTGGLAANKFSTAGSTGIRGIFMDPKGRVIATDGGNNRILIWNTAPTQNGQAADLVLGQADFVSGSANRGGSANAGTLSGPIALWSDGEKLIVGDATNNRVLIWNSFPTTNGQAADVVVGQSTMSGVSTSCDPTHVEGVFGIAVYNGKLLLASANQNRVLVYNSIPTSNGAAADYVLGQTNTSTCSLGTISASTFSSPRGISVDGSGKFYLADRGWNRVLVWNSFPESNRAADIVLGQPNFVTSATALTQGGLSNPAVVVSTGNRLFVSDTTSNRALIWNYSPTRTGDLPDIVLGRPSFTSGNASCTVSETCFKNTATVTGLYATNSKLLVSDGQSSRLLIFNNVTKQPGISLNADVQSTGNNQLKMTGNANVNAPYVVQFVNYAINGGGWQNAVADDGGFNSTSEAFSFFFDPTQDLPKNEDGTFLNGYTVQLKATNSNADTTDHAFYFSPFLVNSPADAEAVKTAYPTFDFSVNKQRVALKENLDHYAVQVRDRSTGSGWTTVIDNIPVDFESHKGDLENVQRAQWESVSTLNGEYETTAFLAKYSEDGSRIAVKSKTTALSGSYEWKVLAIDKAGHSQETGSRNLVVVGSAGSVTPGFPLAVLNISGLGNPNISSYNLVGVKSSYRTTSTSPIFYGIAWSGSTINLQLTQQNCTTNCTQEFTTTANALSRFGINIPAGTLKKSSSYTARLFAQFDSLYTELPSFTLKLH